MEQYISKSALLAEIEKNKNEMEPERDWHFDEYTNGYLDALKEVLSFLDTLEVKEVQEESVRKVWHDSNKEQPKCGSNVVIWSPTLETGELITKCAKVFENRIWAYLNDLIYMQYD